jgi:alginate O-acetyltransferase complex protein AlgI
MLFTTLHWAVFLFAVFAIINLAPLRMRKWLMLAASVYFYSSWSAKYLLLIGAQLSVDWTCGQLLGRTENPTRRRLILASSILVNLGSLCIFKYYHFIASALAHLGLTLPGLTLTLPLAISFYTFESMSYTIDIYRGKLAPVKSPLHLALFLTWFPHLIAGPIIRPSELIPQMDRLSPLTRERFFSGLGLLTSGYIKKLLLADWLAKVADPVFSDPSAYGTIALVAGVYAYAFQIYLDFSAYTDIARGASRWFGIELPENFNLPYLATSITDFWRRWHMTLSGWLRDYLYFSLGGSRGPIWRTYVNLMITMLLGGLWHGASWMFVIWGGIHGLALVVERALGVRAQVLPKSAFALWGRRILTFHIVCAAWVFFRAPDLMTASLIFSGIFKTPRLSISHEMASSIFGAAILIAASWALTPVFRTLKTFDPGPSSARQLAACVGSGLILTIMVVLGATSGAFIYFQF